MNYKIAVSNNKSCNPDFKVEPRTLECDSFLIVTFENEKPKAFYCHQASIDNIAHAISSEALLAEAAALADGIMKAEEVHRKFAMKDRAKELAQMFGDSGDEEEACPIPQILQIPFPKKDDGEVQ